MRLDTAPLLLVGEYTEPIVLDTTQIRVRARGTKRHVVVMPIIDPTPAPPRPAWAKGVVPRRR